MNSRCIAIVDALSSGSLLPAEARKRGFSSVHVQSTDPIPADDAPSFVPGDHIANIVFDGDLERCIKALAPFEPRCVLAGAELGVRLADRLSEALGLPTNGTALSAARRNKFEMHRVVAAAGLATIPSRLATSWAEVEDWVKQNLPVVVKPPASGGTDQVIVCKDLPQARAAFEAIVGKTNVLLETNDQVLIQKFISGTEYLINSVSCEGKHFITDFAKMDKVRGERPLYDRGFVLPARGEVYETIAAYVGAVLDALGIRFGPSHTELMWTESGPVLIEVGARLGGQQIQTSAEVVLGFSQVTVALDAYLQPERFMERAARPYDLERHLHRVELIAPRSGTLAALPHLDDVRALRSFYKVHMYVAPGQPISRTVDMMTIPGYIDLIHDDLDVLEADYQQIRAWESADFYRLVA